MILLTALLAISAQAQTRDWENPAVLGINKLPYHATLQLPSKWKECKEIMSLDGEWLFRWSRNPEERQTDFYREDYDVSSWGKIKVPGNWQTQGYGTPIYTNIEYPFQRNRPSVTSEPPKDWTAYENRNPVGQYVTHRRDQGDAFEESDPALRRCTFGHVSLGERTEGGLQSELHVAR